MVWAGSCEYYPKFKLNGHVHYALRNTESARAYFDTARVELETIKEERPNDPRFQAIHGSTVPYCKNLIYSNADWTPVIGSGIVALIGIILLVMRKGK
jgi:hypothetical protein